ncbi:MAG: DUF308 domain-containing protein [Firmicutes bacterium]|nr:DUF308 domain-containing protein [Bacillota bacterium]
MRIITIIAGAMLALLGIVAVASGGLSFLSLAFPIGLGMLIVGIVECFAYKKAVDDEEDKHWILIEGVTTFLLGVVVISGVLAADVAVPAVFGMWSCISGIRGLVVMFSMKEAVPHEEKDVNYYWDLVTALLASIFGLVAFFNTLLFNMSVLTLVGLIITVQAAVVIKISFSIAYNKPELIKSKAQKVREAEEAAAQAKEEMKEAIDKVREAKAALKEVEEEKEFHEIIAEPVVVEPISIATIAEIKEEAAAAAEEAVAEANKAYEADKEAAAAEMAKLAKEAAAEEPAETDAEPAEEPAEEPKED